MEGGSTLSSISRLWGRETGVNLEGGHRRAVVDPCETGPLPQNPCENRTPAPEPVHDRFWGREPVSHGSVLIECGRWKEWIPKNEIFLSEDVLLCVYCFVHLRHVYYCSSYYQSSHLFCPLSLFYYCLLLPKDATEILYLFIIKQLSKLKTDIGFLVLH